MRRPFSYRHRLSVEPLERRLVLHGGVNPTVTFVTNFGDVEFELLADDAPGTVENFLTYIEDGDYANSIFHRLVPGFVVQGGGFRTSEEFFCPSDGCAVEDIDASDFDAVPVDDPIVNEFGVPNTRGTVAMAKLGGNPDSATSQFFVNLSDNRANLDNQNGGFTVFAQVNDMTVIDTIAALNQADISSIFTDPSQASLRALSQTPFEITDDGYRWVQVQTITGTSVAHGSVFFDADGDGTRDSNEGGRSGITVFDDANQNGTLDNGETSTVTDNMGEYHFTFDGDHTYNLVITDGAGWTQGQTASSGSVEFGRSSPEIDFATRFTAASWHNSATANDVDGVNGVAPIDALRIINELTDREVSDPVSGVLQAATVPTDRLFFPDVTNDGVVAPIDAIRVINQLSADAAATSASVFAEDADDDEGDADSLDASAIDDVFAGGSL